MFTNIPVSNMSECNEFDPDYNTNCSITLLTKLKEWTGAIYHPSVHKIHDFDKHFRSWFYNEGQNISSESLTRHCSNILKCSENRECYTSSKKNDVNKFVSIKDSSMVDNTLDVQRDNRSESFFSPNTTPGQRAAINMVDDTYIPDYVIMEAFNIMRRHSPHLAPYIGQLPPAAQHLLRNSNEAALLPYIPQDKFSVNIHHIDSHWITSVFRPQNKTVYIYDTLRRSDRISRIKKDLTILYGNNLNIQYPNVTQQQNMPDCGAFAVAYAFSVLLGIPPETQEYDVNSMRTHLKTILNSGQMIPFPVSIESNCIADYFSTQTKLLSKKQRLLESAKPLLHNATIMNKKIIKRREYIKAYMCKSRSEESTQKRKDRNQKDKIHKQPLRCKETAQQRQDGNQNSKVHMQTLRYKETAQQRQDRNQKDKVHKQTLRYKETAQQRQDRNQKDKVHKQTLRCKETAQQIQDRNQKDKVHKQTLRCKETAQQRQDRNQKDKVHKQTLRCKETAQQIQDRNQKDKVHKQTLRCKETAQQIQYRNQKDKVHKQTMRCKETAQQRQDRIKKSKICMKMSRSKEPVEKKQKRNNKARRYLEELIGKETPAERLNRRMKTIAWVKKYRHNQKSDDRNKVKHKDKHKRYIQKLCLKQKVYSNACETFKRLARAGPKYVCTVCRRLLYKQSVKNISSKTFSKTSKDLLKLCFSGKVSSYVCSTCSRHLSSGRLPPMSVANKMLLQPIPECLHDLTELEERLVAQRIPFMKIMNLPKGNQKAIIGQVVNVPVDTAETVAALPRTANSSGFIPLKLKRKQSYTGHVLYQMVRPHVVEAALRYLVDHNKHYQNILLNEEWQKDFQNEDEELWSALVEPHEENEHESSTPEVNDNDTLTPRTTSNEEELNSAQELSEVAVNNTVISESAPNGIQEEDYSRLSLTQLCITQYYRLSRLDGPVPVFPLYIIAIPQRLSRQRLSQ